jgi:hypothetical protein
MNYNLISYGVYLSITIYVTVGVGYKIYKLGKAFLEELFPSKLAFCDRVNRLLLLGYYLVNIGYIAISVADWPYIENGAMALQYLFSKIGLILLALGLLHITNIIVLFLLSKSNKFIQLFSN